MSRPNEPRPGHHDAPGEGAYAARLRDELRTRCVHLLTKEMYCGAPGPYDQESPVDTAAWWCDKTSEALGPDGSRACSERCGTPGRICYEAPVRP